MLSLSQRILLQFLRRQFFFCFSQVVLFMKLVCFGKTMALYHALFFGKIKCFVLMIKFYFDIYCQQPNIVRFNKKTFCFCANIMPRFLLLKWYKEKNMLRNKRLRRRKVSFCNRVQLRNSFIIKIRVGLIMDVPIVEGLFH